VINVYRVPMQEIASTQSTGLKVIAYSLGFFHEGHRAIVGPPSMRWPKHFREQVVGVAGSLGTGEIADMAGMGEGRRH
jgi:hypothetical protein